MEINEIFNESLLAQASYADGLYPGMTDALLIRVNKGSEPL